MNFSKYPSIGQFRNVVKAVERQYMFEYDPAVDDYVFVPSNKMPTLTFTGTVKSHGCFEKNTLVHLANGEKEKISNLSCGTYIISHNEITKKDDIKQIINVINQKLDKEWCKLVFDETEIICTKDHKIWTENRGYIEAHKLKTTDIFKTP